VFLLLWGQSTDSIQPPTQTFWQGDGSAPVMLSRSGWGTKDTFVGFKAGSPGTNHGHMDIGSFVLDMNGVRWAVDLGAQNYYSLESKGLRIWNRSQDSDRWTVFRYENGGHNTLVVEGAQQKVNGHSFIIKSSGTSEVPFAIADIAPTYEGQLAKAHRGIRSASGWALIQDEVQALSRPTSIRWGMLTRAEVTLVDGQNATLQQGSQEVLLRVVSPSDARLRIIDVEKPPMEHDAENPNTRMIAFEVDLAALEESRIVVRIFDPSLKDASREIEPLDSWN
jgi:hypothetical protein